jgi:hypothetical protein
VGIKGSYQRNRFSYRGNSLNLKVGTFKNLAQKIKGELFILCHKYACTKAGSHASPMG